MKILDLKTKEPYCKVAPRAKLCLEVEQRRKIGGWVSRVLVLEKTTLYSYKLKGDNGSINTWTIGDSEVYAKRPRKDGRYVILVTRPQAFSVVFAINSLHEQACFLQALASSGATIMGLYGIFLMAEHKDVQSAVKNSLEEQECLNTEEKRFYNSLRDTKTITRPRQSLEIPQLSSRMIGMSWYFNDHVKERRYSAPSSMKMLTDNVCLRDSMENIDLGEVDSSSEKHSRDLPKLDRMISISEETLCTTRKNSDFYTTEKFSSDIENCNPSARVRKVAELVNIFESKDDLNIKNNQGSKATNEKDEINTQQFNSNFNDSYQNTSRKNNVVSKINSFEMNCIPLTTFQKKIDLHFEFLRGNEGNPKENATKPLASTSTDYIKICKSYLEGTINTLEEKGDEDNRIILSGIHEVSDSIGKEFKRKFVCLRKNKNLYLISIEEDSKFKELPENSRNIQEFPENYRKIQEFSENARKIQEISENSEIICLENLSLFITSGNDGKNIIVFKRGGQRIKSMKFETESTFMQWSDKLLEVRTNRTPPSNILTPFTSEETTQGLNNLDGEIYKLNSESGYDEDDILMEKPISDSLYKGLKRRMVIKRHGRTKDSYSLELDHERKNLDWNLIFLSTTTTIITTNTTNTNATTDVATTAAAAATGTAIMTSITIPNTFDTSNNNNNTNNNNINNNNNSNSDNNCSIHSSIKNVITLFENQQINQNVRSNNNNSSDNKISLDNDSLTDQSFFLSNLHNKDQCIANTNKSLVDNTLNDSTCYKASVFDDAPKVKNIVASFNSVSCKNDCQYNIKEYDMLQEDKNHINPNLRQISLSISSQSNSTDSDCMIELNSSTCSDFRNHEKCEDGEECKEEISVKVVKEKFELLSSLIQKNMSLNRSVERNLISRRKNTRNKIKKKKTLEGESRRASIKNSARKNGFSRETSREETDASKHNQSNVSILDILTNEAQITEDDNPDESNSTFNDRTYKETSTSRTS